MLFMNPEGSKILHGFDIIRVLTLIGILFICHWCMRNTSMKEVSKKMHPIILGAIWGILLFLISIAQGSGEQFIYFQF